MRWRGLTNWKKSQKVRWQINNETKGSFKTYNKFNFAMVYGAGKIFIFYLKKN